MTTAYSYSRFATRGQADDSIRRQVDRAADWCRRHGAQLHTSNPIREVGVSAFQGRHSAKGDVRVLGEFLAAVRTGRVERGSYLIIESLERLTRDSVRAALAALLNIIDAGVRVVQLAPVEAIYDESGEPLQMFQGLI